LKWRSGDTAGERPDLDHAAAGGEDRYILKDLVHTCTSEKWGRLSPPRRRPAGGRRAGQYCRAPPQEMVLALWAAKNY